MKDLRISNHKIVTEKEHNERRAAVLGNNYAPKKEECGEYLTDKIETLDAFGIWIVGHDAYPVAIFRYEEEAVEWARENFFGAWLMKRVQMPAIPFCTEEELAEARIEAEKLSALFKQLPEAD